MAGVGGRGGGGGGRGKAFARGRRMSVREQYVGGVLGGVSGVFWVGVETRLQGMGGELGGWGAGGG